MCITDPDDSALMNSQSAVRGGEVYTLACNTGHKMVEAKSEGQLSGGSNSSNAREGHCPLGPFKRQHTAFEFDSI